MTKTLNVWWDDVVVGALSIDRHGDTTFAYTQDYLARQDPRAISISLPLRAAPFSRRESRPFFEGLLPEEDQRVAIADALGVSKQNEFKLLEQLGGEIAGALSLWPEGDTPPDPSHNGTTPPPLTEDALIGILERLPARPMLVGENELRLSLAGAQTKLPVIVRPDGGVALPAPGQPTTHILKPPIARFENTTENEALAMRLAAAIGLDVAPVAIRTVGDHKLLLVARYDRILGADGRVTRLHQEDFCQALGLPSSKKYAAEGGPTIRESFALLRRAATRPGKDVLRLLDAVIFNVVIGNADAHGKNFSLLHRSAETTLAPLYDLLSTVLYPALDASFAMKIAKRATLETLSETDWPRFAEETGLTTPYIKRQVIARAGQIADHCDRIAEELIAEGGAADALFRHVRLLKDRAARAETLAQ